MTTLLGLLGGLDRPTSGSVTVNGIDLATLSNEQVSGLRRDTLGFVFQSFGLLPMLSAAENVELPLRILHTDPADRNSRVAEVLELVGLARHAGRRPYELSGGPAATGWRCQGARATATDSARGTNRPASWTATRRCGFSI